MSKRTPKTKSARERHLRPLADRVKDARLDLYPPRSLRSIAKEAGICAGSLSMIENAKQCPSIFVIKGLAKALNKPLDYFLP